MRRKESIASFDVRLWQRATCERRRVRTWAGQVIRVSGLLVGFWQAAEVGLADDSPSTLTLSEGKPSPPEDLLGELFVSVQMAELFEDQKTFADAVPNREPALIVREYEVLKDDPAFDLEAFVRERFRLPSSAGITPPEGLPLRAHVDWLWPALTRTTTAVFDGDSLLPLPQPYVVPGGRYQELYYWDSYFTMLGLAEAGRDDLVRSMLENFAYELEEFGCIPNGSRTYQLSRSQPPFFSSMVELVAEREGAHVYESYLPELRREHAFWMAGVESTPAGSAHLRVVKLPDGTVLNRYWDERDTPRAESYAYDVATARSHESRPANEIYRDLRAGAESGWDFSSRWLEDGLTLSSIRTTAIIPVDLNSLLFHLEISVVRGCTRARDIACAREFAGFAERRAQAIDRYLWNEAGYYGDYDWQLGKPRDDVTVAMVYPLFVGVATPERARQTAMALEQLLAPGGLLTTTRETGQQWDAPNGWAPLTWIAVAGLRRYDQHALAREIGTRFLASVKALYEAEGRLVEKYDVQGDAAAGGGGGEYPLQDGFGWTNAVTLKLLRLYDSRARNGKVPQPARVPPAAAE
jgi:alpha,alpha-trehalase